MSEGFGVVRHFSRRLSIISAVLVHAAVWVAISAAAAPEEDAADKDYTEQLPRIAPLSPKEAMGSFQVVPGFQMDQVAAEPLVEDPVAVCFDENGRLFVVEMRDYSEDDKANLGLVRLLEDEDGDGHFDKSTIFAEGLSWPTAIHCYDGGVFVAAAPDVFYLKDTDGDGEADVRTLVYTGFQRSNVQGLVNSLHWGLDNRLHGATSSSGADIVTLRDGKPVPDEKPLALRGRDFAFDPKTLAMEATSGGAQHGMSFNEWGDKFVCSNSDHLQMVLYEDRYLSRNPYYAAPGPRISIAADGPQADVYRASPVEPWRIVRTRLRAKGIVPGIVEGGGRPAGYFTGATGSTIYTGNAWPREFYGWAFVGDVGSNLVHRKRLEPHGVGFIGRRVDEKKEFVASTDIWFRPVQFANAPDGALYILDMYREVIEHPASLPPVIKRHLDLTSGRDKGRLYRVIPEGFRQPHLPRLGEAKTAELVATLAHPNGWHRETASRLLYERADRGAIPLLEKLIAESSVPEGRMWALYVLDGLQGLNPATILRALGDVHPRVREHAVRLSERFVRESPEVRERLFQLVSDDALRVRYQLAFTLGDTDDPRRVTALATIVRHDGEQAPFRTAVFSSLGTGAGSLLSDLAADGNFRKSAGGRDWIRGLAAQIGKQQRPDDVAAVLSVLRTLPMDDRGTMQAIVQGIAAKQGTELEKQLAAATGGKADEFLQELLTASAATAANSEAETKSRIEAVSRLRLGKFEDREELFSRLLEPSQPPELQTAVLTTLSALDSPGVAELLLQRWTQMSPRLRTMAADVLFIRQPWMEKLLDATEQGIIAPADLEPSRIKLLTEHRDERIRVRAQKAFAKNQLGSRDDVIQAYQDVLNLGGEPQRGREVFRKICAACHVLEGQGFAIGPNLAAMQNRGPDSILTNVLSPNREVNPQYLNYLVITADGRTLTGMIAAETATSVTLKRAENATDTVLRIDIEEMKSTGLSLMPEGLEKQIDKQAMADVIAYLKSLL